MLKMQRQHVPLAAAVTAILAIGYYWQTRSPEGDVPVEESDMTARSRERATSPHNAPEQQTHPIRESIEEESGDAVAPADVDPTEPVDPKKYVRLQDLPDELRDPTHRAVRSCRAVWIDMGADWPHGSIWITIDGAKRIIATEASLKREKDISGLAIHRILKDRMQTDPALGITYRDYDAENLEDQLAQLYPGWPDGYHYIDVSEERGLRRFAAWKVEDDPELDRMESDFRALAIDYLSAVRANYRIELLFR